MLALVSLSRASWAMRHDHQYRRTTMRAFVPGGSFFSMADVS